MKTNRNQSFVEAAAEFAKIRADAISSYPAAKRRRDRLELLAYLRALASEFHCALEALRELKPAERPTPTPPWLSADAPMAQLREYRLKIWDHSRPAAGASVCDEETARERAWLEREPRQGHELLAACQDMVWFQDVLLLAEIFAEAADASALPVEDNEDFVDESARARMAAAKQNRTLARMKDHKARGDTDLAAIGSSTKAVERGRKRIDGWLREAKEAYKTTVEAGVKILAQNYPWAFADADEPRRILASADDLNDPENRLRMKRWLTTQIVVDTAEEWAKDIRKGVFGDGRRRRKRSRATTAVAPIRVGRK